MNTIGATIHSLDVPESITLDSSGRGEFLIAESRILDCVWLKDFAASLRGPTALILKADYEVWDYDDCRVAVQGNVDVYLYDRWLHLVGRAFESSLSDQVGGYFLAVTPHVDNASVSITLSPIKGADMGGIVVLLGLIALFVVPIVFILLAALSKRRAKQRALENSQTSGAKRKQRNK